PRHEVDDVIEVGRLDFVLERALRQEPWNPGRDGQECAEKRERRYSANRHVTWAYTDRSMFSGGAPIWNSRCVSCRRLSPTRLNSSGPPWPQPKRSVSSV